MPPNPRYSALLVLKDHGPDLDISNNFITLEYTETGNEEISSAIIKLNAHFGRFMVDGITVGGTSYPKVEFFDRLYLKITDPDGNVVEDVLEVINKFPSEEPGYNNVLEIHASNQGWHFSNQHFAKQYQRQSGFEVVKDICSSYNSNVGPKDPTIEKHDADYSTSTRLGNAMSKATRNDWEFGTVETFCNQGVQQVSDFLGSSVDVGGELEFFDWRFVPKYDHGTGSFLDVMQLSVAVSGQVNSKVTISNADSVAKITNVKGRQEPEKGTNQLAEGDPIAGSLPTDFSKYFSEKEKFFAVNDWDGNSIKYLVDMRVHYDGKYYLCITEHTSSPGTTPDLAVGTLWTDQGSSWTSALASYDYSPWTKDKAQYWINAGGGYVHSGTHPANNKAANIDHNLVIRDDNHRRSWVDGKFNDPSSIPSDMLKSGSPFRTLRILCETPGGVWTQNSGKDRFGVSYTNAVIKHNGGTFSGSEEYKNWDVFLSAKNDMEIYDFREGEAWTFNPCGTGLNANGSCIGARLGGWQKGAYILAQFLGVGVGLWTSGGVFDCAHPYNIVGTNNPDFGNADGIEGGVGTPGENSAVRCKYTWTSGSRSVGAWLNFAFPWPRNGNSTPFGAVTIGEQYLPDTLDSNNMHLTHDEKRGFNQGLSSEDLKPLTAVRVFTKLTAKNLGGSLIAQGDFRIRLVLFDSSDNVVAADKVIGHNDNMEELTFQLNEFKIYRARPGLPFTPVRELEILNIFEWRNICRGAIFTLDSYDNEGRYLATNRFISQLASSLEIQADGYHWPKPLLVTTQEQSNPASKPDRNLEPTFLKRPRISNYFQLKNDAKSMLEIAQFRRVEYEIKRALRCNIRFGEEFKLKHPRVVDDSDVSPNDEVDLVCKKNIYSISKGKGAGGFLVTTIGVKRFRT